MVLRKVKWYEESRVTREWWCVGEGLASEKPMLQEQMHSSQREDG